MSCMALSDLDELDYIFLYQTESATKKSPIESPLDGPHSGLTTGPPQ